MTILLKHVEHFNRTNIIATQTKTDEQLTHYLKDCLYLIQISDIIDTFEMKVLGRL